MREAVERILVGKNGQKYALATNVMGAKKHVVERNTNSADMRGSDAYLKPPSKPIGIDLRSISPEQVAFSILAKIVATKRDRSKKQIS